MTLAELRDRWLSEAAHLRAYNAGAAHAFETAARELEAVLQDADNDALTLADASRESGYSADHLRHLVASQQLPNAGRKGAPRIRRKDLPRRAGVATTTTYDPSADALRLVSGARNG